MKASIIIPFKEETAYLSECIKHCQNLDDDDFGTILLHGNTFNLRSDYA